MKVAVVVGVAVQHDAISAAAARAGLARCARCPTSMRSRLFTQGRRPRPGLPTLRHSAIRGSWCAIRTSGRATSPSSIGASTSRCSTPSPCSVGAASRRRSCTSTTARLRRSSRRTIATSIDALDPAVPSRHRPRRTPLWTYSEFNRRTLIDWGAARATDRVGHVPGPDARRARAASREAILYLLSVGRLVPAKGVHVLIDALDAAPRCRCSSASGCASSAARRSRPNDYRDALEEQIRDGWAAAGEGSGVRRRHRPTPSSR